MSLVYIPLAQAYNIRLDEAGYQSVEWLEGSEHIILENLKEFGFLMMNKGDVMNFKGRRWRYVSPVDSWSSGALFDLIEHSGDMRIYRVHHD